MKQKFSKIIQNEMQLKILFDLSSLNNFQTGIGVYINNLLRGLKDIGINNIILLVSKYNQKDVIEKNYGYEYIILKQLNCTVLKKIHLSFLVNSYLWKKSINNSGCTEYFSPSASLSGDILHFMKLKVRHIQVIHDLQNLKVLRGFKRWLYKLTISAILHNADAIISISDYVKNDLYMKYKFLSTKNIRTIYNSVVISSDNTSKKTSCNYILYVNSLTRHKNLITLLKAYNLVKKSINYKLVIIGKLTEYWNDTIIPFIEKNNLSKDISCFSNVSELELVNFYKNASLFITTSLCEGFGYTPIEAAICKIPVISSKDSSLYETTLGLLNYYEPAMDYIALTEKIISILNDPPCAKKLSDISNMFQKKYEYKDQASEVYNYITELRKVI